MPVTPRFSLSQDDEFVHVSIRVPYVRAGNMEYAIDGSIFSFFVKPYLLRLNLPGDIVDDERAQARYDASDNNGTVTIRLPKAEPGFVFEDLDLLTKLKEARKAAPKSTPLIEVVSSAVTPGYMQCLEEYANLETLKKKTKEVKVAGKSEPEAETKVDKGYSKALLELEELVQGVSDAAVGDRQDIELQPTSVKYGFNNNFSGFFKDLSVSANVEMTPFMCHNSKTFQTWWI